MTAKIRTPIIDELYQECVTCIIDDLNDLTVYGIRDEIGLDLINERKEYIGKILMDLHKDNQVWISDNYSEDLFSKVKGDIHVGWD